VSRTRPTAEPGQLVRAAPALVQGRRFFYEIHIRGFFDGNDDGSGDFRGLIEKARLPAVARHRLHLALPMYQSPLRDGGYDIADFFGIHPTTAASTTSRLRRAGAPARASA
jgi:maltose alpha-D-glucosyltransferase/alpha-amylase